MAMRKSKVLSHINSYKQTCTSLRLCSLTCLRGICCPLHVKSDASAMDHRKHGHAKCNSCSSDTKIESTTSYPAGGYWHAGSRTAQRRFRKFHRSETRQGVCCLDSWMAAQAKPLIYRKVVGVSAVHCSVYLLFSLLLYPP